MKSITECSKFERVSDKKELFFFMRSVFCHDCFCRTLYRGAALFNSSKAVEGECIGPAFSPHG